MLKIKLNGLAHDRGTNLSDTFRVTDSFLYNPILFGELGLANPFIPLLLIEPNLRGKTPAQHVDDFIEHEQSDFKTRQRAFGQESPSSKEKRRAEIFLGNKGYDEDEINVDFDNFLTFEEYTKHRESTSPAFRKLYDKLMSQPAVSNVHLSDWVKTDLERLAMAGAKGVKLMT